MPNQSPEHEQFDSAREDVEEEGSATSALDTEPDASMGKEMEASGCSSRAPSAERHRQRNCAMRRERTRACREFWGPKNKRLSFPLFRETTKEDAISYRDWCSEIEEALQRGHDAAKVKEAMFASLEGMPKINPQPLGDTVDALEMWYNDGFLIGLHQATEISKHRSGHCFNCQEGHRWHQCKILSSELQELSNRQDREREERKKKALNPRGGMGMKGGHAPTLLVGISLVLPQVPDTPTQ